MPTHIGRAEKDEVEILPYTFDWGSKWMEPDDKLRSSSWRVPAGLTQGDGTNGAPLPSFTDTLATVWLIGGTAGAVYTIENTVTAGPDPTGNPPKTAKRSAAVAVVPR